MHPIHSGEKSNKILLDFFSFFSQFSVGKNLFDALNTQWRKVKQMSHDCCFCHNAQSASQTGTVTQKELFTSLCLRWICRTKSSPVISFLDKNQSLSNFYDKAIGWTMVQMMQLLVGILYSSCLITVAPILYPEINHYYPSFIPNNTYILKS